MGFANTVATIPAQGRKLENWIDAFTNYSASLFAPSLFRKWAGISIISTVLERRVWVHTRAKNLYPNLYIFLVGPPGAGKGLILDEVNRLLGAVTGQGTPADLHIAPTSVTTSSLVDTIAEAKRKILRPTEHPPYVEFHSLAVVVPEFSDFAPMYDPRFMSALQSFYDCSDVPFGERRRSKDTNIKILNPQLGLIAGTTPSYLNGFMPEGAWDQGFISRTIMIYSSEVKTPNLFVEDRGKESLALELKADLKSIFNIFGKMTWTPEAAEFIQEWINAGQKPVPEHRRLVHYSTRRIGHLIKLSMVASIAQDNVLVIEKHHIELALSWLLEAEELMPEIFKSASGAGDSAVIEDCWFFLYKEYSRTKEPIPEHRIVNFLRDRMPAHSVVRAMDVMEKSMLIVKVDPNGPGGSFRYRPKEKQ